MDASKKRTWTAADLDFLRVAVGGASEDELTDAAWWVATCARQGIDTSPGALYFAVERACANTQQQHRAKHAMRALKQASPRKPPSKNGHARPAKVTVPAKSAAPVVERPKARNGIEIVGAIPDGWVTLSTLSERWGAVLKRQDAPGFVRWRFLANGKRGKMQLLIPTEDADRWLAQRKRNKPAPTPAVVASLPAPVPIPPPVVAPKNGVPCAHCRRVVLAQLLQMSLLTVEQFATLA